MPSWFIETLKDPIFQLAVVAFIAAFAMFWWMVFQSRRKSISPPEGKSTHRTDDTIISSPSIPLTQDAKFQLVLENVIAINRRLDEIEKRLTGTVGSGALHHPTSATSTYNPQKDEEINRKLDAIYKILSSISTKTE